ncbi:MAG: c-type cytochrome [Nitrospirae bacterium]|nr:c-type cytochrome [Nitrospirota bacterium]
MRWACLILLMILLTPSTGWGQEKGASPGGAGAPPAAPSPQDLQAGKRIYQKWCMNCHGAQGDGAGPAADFLRPRPRDFRQGLFKIRTTQSGQLPSDQDLFNVITKGMPGTGMPGWEKVLTEAERWQLVSYLKTFSRRFARASAPPEPIRIGTQLPLSADSAAEGKRLFREIECFKCHGDEGRGDGPSAPELTDDWGAPIRPANLRKPWTFRGGHTPEALYLRLQSGIAGSPMPSFADSLDNEKTWHLVNYVMSLWQDSSGNNPPLQVVLKARRVEGEIPAQPGEAFWQDQEPFYYPLVGQVIREPRLFVPSVDGVQVQAVYNDRELALRLVWDDPTNSKADAEQGTFEDAAAIEFPVQVPPGAKRPFFLMGDAELAVQLLRWGSSSGMTELNGNGLDKLQPQSESSQESTAVGEFQNGQYQVVMKRPLRTVNTAQDIQFETGRFIPVAFFAWDGSNGETGGKMALTSWFYFFIEPALPKVTYVYPALAVVIAGGLQWWVVRRLRQTKMD